MISKGLKTLSQESVSFNTQNVDNPVRDATIGWCIKNKVLEEKIRESTVLTEANKLTARTSLNSIPYINIGKAFADLEQHAQNIIDGVLGEKTSDTDDRPTFLEHMQVVDSIQSLSLSNLGTSADNAGKGVNDHFGTLNNVLDADILSIRQSLVKINNRSLGTDTTYQNALQALIDYIDTLNDSTAFNSGTFTGHLSTISTAATNFDTAIAGDTLLLLEKNNMINKRQNIVDQITKETNNLGTIRTYSDSLVNTSALLTLTDNADLRSIVAKTTGSSAWRDYFNSYDENYGNQNPLLTDTTSQNESQLIADMLRLKGLPDVLDPIDLDSVASKAKRDRRLSKKNYDSLLTEQIITQASLDLGLTISGKDVYSQSRQLLNDLNAEDKRTIQEELNLAKDINTLT
jgi:hypothetical protein|tara:strand:- start:3485 stop:4693 length:1209 start_codon:yes stop_codon:yes gene_type:complete